MKQRLFVPVVGVLLGIAISTTSLAAVHAQQNQPSLPENVAPQASNSQTEHKERLEKRATKYPAGLNNAEKTRLSGRCVGAQQKLVAISQKYSDNSTPLKAKYEAYIARLQKIGEKAEARGIDTAEFKTRQTEFNQKYQQMLAAANEFNLSVSDLKSVDCQTDTAAFKATLEAARIQLSEVRALRVELVKTAKGPLLESIKTIKTAAEKKED